MCRSGSWIGFYVHDISRKQHINGNYAVFEQCDECGHYRAKIIDDMPIVRPDNQPDAEKEDDGWSVDR